MTRDWTRAPYTISTDRAWLDLDVIHGYLSRSYWAQGRSRERVAISVQHSLPFGLYHCPAGGSRAQVGFARVVTDHATMAYLADVFVLEPHRGRGLGVWLVETSLGVPELRPLGWLLGTRDAHELYRKFEFHDVGPGRMMRREPPPDLAAGLGTLAVNGATPPVP
jgi:GNAT superfamily N-acetyltransferase